MPKEKAEGYVEAALYLLEIAHQIDPRDETHGAIHSLKRLVDEAQLNAKVVCCTGCDLIGHACSRHRAERLAKQ